MIDWPTLIIIALTFISADYAIKKRTITTIIIALFIWWYCGGIMIYLAFLNKELG